MEAERTHANAPVPPYEAWPSAPKSSLNMYEEDDRNITTETGTPISFDEHNKRAASVLSMDDLEAAQALEGLRADSLQSQRRQPSTLSSKIDPALRSPEDSESQQPEPLLSLLTSQHPLISTAINGSLSAYTSSKSYSPRFRYGAEFVERHIGTPVASTVGTAGRISGVEGNVRRWLQRSDSNEIETDRTKRRRVGERDDGETDVEKGLQQVSLQPYVHRRSSDMSFAESLPAYDDQRSPSYEEHSDTVETRHPRQETHSPNIRNWQTRLMMSTSGLGIAMSEESLRSLKYCLSWLRWANNHLARVLASLHSVLEEYGHSQIRLTSDTPMTDEEHEQTRLSIRKPRDEATITQHIQALKDEIKQTLKSVVDIVSRYAGGALPENARKLVRTHLTSLPHRFIIASNTNPRERSDSSDSISKSDNEQQSRTSETVSSAQRVMVLAREGLDMMAQVSGVVDGTIVSAEEWCDRLGRRRERQEERGNGNGNGRAMIEETRNEKQG